jgi:hypothetical protein
MSAVVVPASGRYMPRTLFNWRRLSCPAFKQYICLNQPCAANIQRNMLSQHGELEGLDTAIAAVLNPALGLTQWYSYWWCHSTWTYWRWEVTGNFKSMACRKQHASKWPKRMIRWRKRDYCSYINWHRSQSGGLRSVFFPSTLYCGAPCSFNSTFYFECESFEWYDESLADLEP